MPSSTTEQSCQIKLLAVPLRHSKSLKEKRAQVSAERKTTYSIKSIALCIQGFQACPLYQRQEKHMTTASMYKQVNNIASGKTFLMKCFMKCARVQPSKFFNSFQPLVVRAAIPKVNWAKHYSTNRDSVQCHCSAALYWMKSLSFNSSER